MTKKELYIKSLVVTIVTFLVAVYLLFFPLNATYKWLFSSSINNLSVFYFRTLTIPLIIVTIVSYIAGWAFQASRTFKEQNFKLRSSLFLTVLVLALSSYGYITFFTNERWQTNPDNRVYLLKGFLDSNSVTEMTTEQVHILLGQPDGRIEMGKYEVYFLGDDGKFFDEYSFYILFHFDEQERIRHLETSMYDFPSE